MNLTKVSHIRYVFGLSHVLTFVLVIRLLHVHVLEEFYFMQNEQILRDALFDTSESKPSEGKPLEHTHTLQKMCQSQHDFSYGCGHSTWISLSFEGNATDAMSIYSS